MYSGLADPRLWCLPRALTEMAQQRPDEVWLLEVDGGQLTFGEAHNEALQAATFFAGLGVARGDRVGLFMTSGCDFVRAWFGLGKIGATSVLFNSESRASFLQHQVNHSGVRTLVVHASLLAELIALAQSLPLLADIVVVGDPPDVLPAQWKVSSWADFKNSPRWTGADPDASEIACIMYTSGTSGPSKGVMMPHAHCTLYGIGALRSLDIGDNDRYYITLPLFHANGMFMQLGATLLAGISAVIRPKFSASRWLHDIRSYNCTLTNLLGATAAFIISQPELESDGRHCLRAVLSAPNIRPHEDAFRRRFKVRDVISGFGMTECNLPVWGKVGSSAPGAAGWVHEDHFEVRIVDGATDAALAHGMTGEIVVRPKVPFGFMAGYLNEPQKTVDAWRNLWFHTGDAGQMDADGLVTFIDRLKDCIRRRGENISPGEIEAVVLGLPGISEAAAYAVASDIPGAEDEIMLAVVCASDEPLALRKIVEQAGAQLPRFAIPRYVSQFDELPKTATGKVQRAVLRQRGIEGALDLTLEAVVAPN